MDWFNRMAEHWVIPRRIDLEEHVRRAGLQVVQTGTFGPQFYGLADDETVDRGWVGMPCIGIEANLDHALDLVPRLQAAGARVVGQMSMSWHYGDHETGKGLFGNWTEIWDQYLPGKPPCPNAEETQQRADDGDLRRWPIEGRPYFAYSGCMCNPHWLTMLAAMLERAIELGIDGVNVHHNFENFCACTFCRDELGAWMRQAFDADECHELFGSDDSAETIDFRHAARGVRTALAQRHAHEVQRAIHHRRKAAFDEVFIKHGRRLKPDLVLAQWYHKYDFGPQDERSLLSPELWAHDEDYIWYSQGANKGDSDVAHGYLADMGLPARFVHAAGEGRPFVINKYDYKRWRLSIAEGAANHFAPLAFHWSQDADETFPLEDYTGPVYRYQRFVADHDEFIAPTRPFSQIGLVVPRRGELAAEHSCFDALKRLGRLLEDGHQLFDMLMDHQILMRDLSSYRLLILPDVARLGEEEISRLLAFADNGGRVLCTGTTSDLDVDGHPRESALAAAAGLDPAGPIQWLDHVDTQPDTFTLRPDVVLPRVPELAADDFGRHVLERVSGLLEGSALQTDAPWWVRLRTWTLNDDSALVLHAVNYRQMEDSAVEVPCPMGQMTIRCPLPVTWGGRDSPPSVRVDWRYPEGEAPQTLAHQVTVDETGTHHVEFTIPSLIVYGLAVIHLQDAS